MPFNLLPIFQQVPLITLVPAWFYLFSGLVYLLVGIVGFLVSYFAFKFFRVTSSKSQSVLSISFLLLGLSFAILSTASFYTYQSSESFDTIILNLNTNAYTVYYLLSLVAYLLLVMINVPKKSSKSSQLYAFVPLWFIGSPEFHSTALLLLIYVAARSVYNFFKVKSEESFLVMFAFLAIVLFHVFLLLMPFGIELYLVAHLFLITGFLSLLAMLIRVTRK